MSVFATRPSTFGHWLKRLRAQQDLTQEALAELAYCSVQTIRFFESGKRRPSLEMAERLAQILAVPAAELADFLQMARRPLAPDSNAAPAVEPDPSLTRADGAPVSNALLALPTLNTTLIGREGERNVLLRLLEIERHRLVTLVGAGGMGKTRLALEAATALTTAFADGVAFVALTPLQTVSQLSATVAEALQLAAQTGHGDVHAQLLAWLAPRQLLLVLDNFEHLLDSDATAAVNWLKTLLQEAPTLQLLVTSRERLRMRDERIFELASLGLPGPGTPPEAAEAVLLFLERAQQVSPDFTLNPHNSDAITQICRLVNGMPLGIELAAAWVRVLSCEEIAEEMVRSLDFLVRTDRDADPRHYSMRAVFDSSWRLLAPAEQRVAARLAVLRGNFDRAAAQAITDAKLPQLATLIDKSLLRVTTVEGANATGMRYEIHELLRQYLFAQLQAAGEAAQIQARHAAYFTALAAQLDPYLYTHKVANWRTQMQREQNNFYAALTWTLEEAHDPTLGLQLAGLLGRLWEAGYAWKEGRRWLQLALQKSAEQGALRARALVKLGELHHLLEEQTSAEQCLRDGLAIWQALGEMPNVAYTLFQLGKATATRGDFVQAQQLLQASLQRYRQMDDTWGIVTVLNQLAGAASHLGDYAAAEAYLDEAWPLIQDMPQRMTAGVAANLLGRTLLGQGEISRAVVLFERALRIFEEEEAASGIAWSLINLALAALLAEEWRNAPRYFADCFAIYRRLESKGGMMAALEGLAAVAAHEGDHARAVQLQAVAARWQQESGQLLTELETTIQVQTRQATQSILGQEAWTQIWASTLHWSVDEVAAAVM